MNIKQIKCLILAWCMLASAFMKADVGAPMDGSHYYEEDFNKYLATFNQAPSNEALADLKEVFVRLEREPSTFVGPKVKQRLRAQLQAIEQARQEGLSGVVQQELAARELREAEGVDAASQARADELARELAEVMAEKKEPAARKVAFEVGTIRALASNEDVIKWILSNIPSDKDEIEGVVLNFKKPALVALFDKLGALTFAESAMIQVKLRQFLDSIHSNYGKWVTLGVTFDERINRVIAKALTEPKPDDAAAERERLAAEQAARDAEARRIAAEQAARDAAAADKAAPFAAATIEALNNAGVIAWISSNIPHDGDAVEEIVRNQLKKDALVALLNKLGALTFAETTAIRENLTQLLEYIDFHHGTGLWGHVFGRGKTVADKIKEIQNKALTAPQPDAAAGQADNAAIDKAQYEGLDDAQKAAARAAGLSIGTVLKVVRGTDDAKRAWARGLAALSGDILAGWAINLLGSRLVPQGKTGPGLDAAQAVMNVAMFHIENLDSKARNALLAILNSLRPNNLADKQLEQDLNKNKKLISELERKATVKEGDALESAKFAPAVISALDTKEKLVEWIASLMVEDHTGQAVKKADKGAVDKLLVELNKLTYDEAKGVQNNLDQLLEYIHAHHGKGMLNVLGFGRGGTVTNAVNDIRAKALTAPGPDAAPDKAAADKAALDAAAAKRLADEAEQARLAQEQAAEAKRLAAAAEQARLAQEQAARDAAAANAAKPPFGLKSIPDGASQEVLGALVDAARNKFTSAKAALPAIRAQYRDYLATLAGRLNDGPKKNAAVTILGQIPQ